MDDPSRAHLRVSDADREATAALLRRHATEGRLTLDELDERLGLAYAGRTFADLAQITSDLPPLGPEHTVTDVVGPGRWSARQARRTGRSGAPAGGPVARRSSGVPAAMWGSFVSANLVLIVIWLLTNLSSDDASWSPWFLWVTGIWGATLLGREIQTRMGGPEHER